MTSFLAVGLFFVMGGLLMRPRARTGELRAGGTVVESRRGWALGHRTWLNTVEFRDAAGTTWRFQPALTTARQRAVGSRAEVVYLPSDPQATARMTDGLDGYLHWIVVSVGAAVAVGSVFALLW